MSPYARFAWGVLGYNLVVILWGAFVRATGSGAGCGSHWPLCNGEVVPRAPQIETMIEFGHRASSGLLLLLGIVLLAWAFRAFPKGHLVRKGVALSLLFLVTEALLGAGLVLLEYVGDNASLARAGWVAAHLVNTFFLTAALTLHAWWASGGEALRLRGQGVAGGLLALALAGALVLGVTGAVTALGATLYPAGSIAEGVTQDLSQNSPLLLRLRLVHPAVAVGVGLYLIVVASLIQHLRPGDATRRYASWIMILFSLQVAVGLVNMALHAPVALQLVHLLLADLLWIALVLLTATVLSQEAQPRAVKPGVPVPRET
ncbi:MAG: COX15/CtaA family protein [Ardenticatenaceae bacterium]